MNSNPLVRGVTRDIMAVLKITDEELALRVEDEMHQHIRFSECTRRQFNREAKIALDVIRYLEAQKVAV
jgi:hypothetical protein